MQPEKLPLLCFPQAVQLQKHTRAAEADVVDAAAVLFELRQQAHGGESRVAPGNRMLESQAMPARCAQLALPDPGKHGYCACSWLPLSVGTFCSVKRGVNPGRVGDEPLQSEPVV